MVSGELWRLTQSVVIYGRWPLTCALTVGTLHDGEIPAILTRISRLTGGEKRQVRSHEWSWARCGERVTPLA